MKQKDFPGIFKEMDERRKTKVNTLLVILMVLVGVTVLMGFGSTFNIHNLVAGQAYEDASSNSSIVIQVQNNDSYQANAETQTETKSGFFASIWAKLTGHSEDKEQINETDDAENESEVKVGLWTKIKAFLHVG